MWFGSHILNLLLNRLYIVFAIFYKGRSFTWTHLRLRLRQFNFIFGVGLLSRPTEEARLDQEHNWHQQNRNNNQSKCNRILFFLGISNQWNIFLFCFRVFTRVENSGNHYIYDGGCTSVVIVTFVLWEGLVILIEFVVKFLLVHHCFVLDIQVFEPLGVNQNVHPPEESPENDDAGDDFGEENWPSAEIHCVCSFANYTNCHMNYSHDDR